MTPGRRHSLPRRVPLIMAACVSACLIALPPEAAGQPTGSTDRPTRAASVTATTTAISVDGVLSEEAWRAAPTIGDLVQRQPLPGQPPTEHTEVRLLYDRDHLYIGIIAHDAEPGRIISTQMARDGSLASDDSVEILLDTFRDQSSAFYFATNPSGAFVDGLAANGQLNMEWDAIWDVRAKRTEQGWVAEFAIPFKSLSFPAGSQAWGFNVARHIFRKLEDGRWSGARLNIPFLQMSEAGLITNLEGLTQGVGLNIRPFTAGRWLHTGGTDTGHVKPGLDLFYNLTPSLKITGTLNTDFGETEVDARQINLSRFSLLFPEKRTFFLEGTGVFNFASTGPEVPGGIPPSGADVYPFFSRQIGLLAGQEVPIEAGVKVTGTVGRMNVGLLDVRTGDLTVGQRLIVDSKNFFVARVRRNLFQQSYIGGIFTNGRPALGQSGQTYGVDMRLATSRLLGRPRSLIVNGYGVRSVNQDRTGKDWSYGFSAHYPNDVISGQVLFREVQENFLPAIGFVQRDNIRLLRVAGSYNPRPKTLLNILQMNHDVFFTRFTRLDNGEVESSDVYVTWWDWHFKSGDNIHGILDYNPMYERLFEPFELSPGVILQPGEYRFTRLRNNLFSTATKRPLFGTVTVTFGNYWSGKAEQVQASVTYRIPPMLTIALNTNQTFARLPEGHFTARIVTATVNYARSPLLSLSNLIQFDNRSRNLGWQGRIRWTLRPGNDLFFAVNQGWIQEDSGNLRFRHQDGRLSTKFQYTFRY